MARSGCIDEVKLRVAVPLDPDRAGRDVFGAAHGDEQAREFLAVAPAVGQRPASALQFAVAILDLVTDGVVDRLDLLPALEIRAGRFGEPYDLRIAGFDVGAGTEMGFERPVGLLRGLEAGGVFGREDRRPFEFERHHRLRLLPRGEVGDLDHQLLDVAW